MCLLYKKFSLKLGDISEKHKIEGSKVSDISKFLTSLGLKKDEVKSGERIRLTFKGNMTLKDFKKIKE
jgi:predicted transcriptional regulator